MRLRAGHLFLFAMVLTVGACRWGSPKEPTGQVVATVGDREITVRQLHAELGGAVPATPGAQKAQQRVALDHILERSILAEEAKKQGLDKDPNFILLSERANDALLVQMLQEKIAGSVPAPTTEEASHFEDANPDIFAERKIFDVDQIRMARPADSRILLGLKPLNTMDDVAKFLNQNHIAFERSTSSIDAVGQNPKVVSAIVALPPKEVFIISSGNLVLVNLIVGTRTVPFIGQPASKYALYLLRTQHTQEAVQRAFVAILTKGRGSVRLAKEFQAPAKRPAAAAAARPNGS